MKEADTGSTVWSASVISCTPRRWCNKAEWSVNGSAANATPNAKGFVRLQRLWRRKDECACGFPWRQA